MQAIENLLFTANEAAVLTRLTVKAVNNAIDNKIVPATAGRRAGRAARLLDLRALMSLTLERRLNDRLAPVLRREVFELLATAPRRSVSLEGGLLRIDLREPRRELASSLRDLRRARGLVTTDPEVKGGEPVFRGTRVQVHMIADLLKQGIGEADLLQDYPRLTIDMIQAAPIYAAAYPVIGRPRVQPWHSQPPVRQVRRTLAEL